MGNLLKLVDDEILRLTSKLTKKWEGTGHSKYSLGLFVSGSSVIFNSLSTNILIGYPLAYFNGYECGQNFNGLIYGKHNSGLSEENGEQVIDNNYFYTQENFVKSIRSSSFLLGSGLILKGAFDLYQGISQDGPYSLDQTNEELSLGCSLITCSLSNYIRNSDPKLIDKDSLFVKFQSKLNTFLPSKTLSPKPIESNSLESILK